MEKVADYSASLQQRDVHAGNLADNSARKMVIQWLSKLACGQLRLEEEGNTQWFGEALTGRDSCARCALLSRRVDRWQHWRR